MNSSRKFDNQSYKKRVDHEGGAHRAGMKLPEPASCPKCGSIYSEGRWVSPKFVSESGKHSHWRPSNSVVCQACKQIENHIVGGYLTMNGGFLARHHDEIIKLIENEAIRAVEDNPLSRIMERIETADELLVETTTEHMAQRLGHALNRAFAGKVTYDFSHENKVARVNWHRD